MDFILHRKIFRFNDGTLTPTYRDISRWQSTQWNGSSYTINPAENNPTDSIVCTASSVDTDGATIDTSSTITIENTAPTIDAFSISPSTSVEANVTLEMVYSASDIDAETLNVSFAWVDDTGTLLGSNSTLTIDNGRPVGSTITATITVTDNYGSSDTTSDTITILNTAPTVSNPASISASPSPITTGVLTCSASFSDYNDGSLTPTYAWTLSDGTPLAAIGDTLTIDSGSTNPTDEIFCTASATDNDGAPISTSTSVIIENTAPTIDAFSISPSTSVEANVTLEMVFNVSI